MRKRVCAACGEEFSRRIFGINMGLRRKERCPHCKRWNTFDIHGNNVDIISGDMVKEKEVSGLDKAEGLSEEERLKRKLEESRYE